VVAFSRTVGGRYPKCSDRGREDCRSDSRKGLGNACGAWIATHKSEVPPLTKAPNIRCQTTAILDGALLFPNYTCECKEPNTHSSEMAVVSTCRLLDDDQQLPIVPLLDDHFDLHSSFRHSYVSPNPNIPLRPLQHPKRKHLAEARCLWTG
jgi:hypothetical protein